MERQFKHPSARFAGSSEIQPGISWSCFHSKHHFPKSPQSWHNVLDLFLAHLGLEKKMKCIQIFPSPANIILHQWVIRAGLETVNIIHRISNISLDGDWEYSFASVFSCGAWHELLKEVFKVYIFFFVYWKFKLKVEGMYLSKTEVYLHKTYHKEMLFLLRGCYNSRKSIGFQELAFKYQFCSRCFEETERQLHVILNNNIRPLNECV